MDSWYKLRLAKVKDSAILKLMNLYEEFDEIFTRDKEFYKLFLKLNNNEIIKIFESRKIDFELEKEKLEKLEIKVISMKDKKYPIRLKNISHPPVFLYIKGKILFPDKNIGVVGTRKMTKNGEAICEKLVGELVNSGVTITSGLALGVDVTAHKRTLNMGGHTIAVVGCGLDVIYPPENKYQWEQIAKNGTLISEYPLGTPPNRYNFPERNRIIVGLTRGVAVIESYKKGGSLITAMVALDENREVFVIPGFPSYPSFEGNNNLIRRSYGKLITNGNDILEEYGWEDSKTPPINIEVSPEEEKVYNSLDGEESLEELLKKTKIPIGKLLGILTNLELKKLVKAVAGGKYQKR